MASGQDGKLGIRQLFDRPAQPEAPARPANLFDAPVASTKTAVGEDQNGSSRIRRRTVAALDTSQLIPKPD